MCYRDCLELDIASALSSRTFTATRDLLFQIQSLNTVLKRATDNVCFYDYADKLMHARRGVEIFVWVSLLYVVISVLSFIFFIVHIFKCYFQC